MQINDINYEKKQASLVLSRDEIHRLRHALGTVNDMNNEKGSAEDKWLHLQLVGVDDILKDGNFSRFLGYHRRLLEVELEKEKLKEEKEKI